MSFRFHTSWKTQYFHSLTFPQILILTLGAMMSIVSGWYLFVQQPLIQEHTKKKLEQKNLKEQYALSERNQEGVALLEQECKQLEQSLQDLLKNCNHIRVALDFLVHLLGVNQLSCQDIRPFSYHDAMMQDLVRYDIHITARGSYQSMYQFLDELSLCKEFIPLRIKIKKNSKGNLELQLVCNVLVQAEETA